MSTTPEPVPMLSTTPSLRVRSARELGALWEGEEQTSQQAVQGALQVLKAGDSTAKDKFTALRILLFLTFEDPQSSKFARALSMFLFLSIVLNCVAFITGSVKSTQIRPESCLKPVCTPGPDSPCTRVICAPVENPILHQIELWTIVIFTIDYLIRVLCVSVVPADLVFPRSLGFTVDGKIKDTASRANMGTPQKVIKYLFSWLNIVDVVSIVPFYISMSLPNSLVAKDLGVMRVMRLLRVLRVFKLGKYTEGGLIIGRTLRASMPALVLFIFLTTVLTTVFGSIMYFFEGGMFQVTQEFPAGGFLRPNARHTGKEESPFTSILMGIYWVVVNTTTLGNAALFPTTNGGRVCSCFVAYMGIIALALPVSIVGKNFTEQYNMVYDREGGPYISAPCATAAANHDRMIAHQQEEEEAAAKAAKAASLGAAATIVTAKRVSSDEAEERADRSVKLIEELQARLARLEGEVTSLRSQLQSVAAPTQGEQQ